MIFYELPTVYPQLSKDSEMVNNLSGNNLTIYYQDYGALIFQPNYVGLVSLAVQSLSLYPRMRRPRRKMLNSPGPNMSVTELCRIECFVPHVCAGFPKTSFADRAQSKLYRLGSGKTKV